MNEASRLLNRGWQHWVPVAGRRPASARPRWGRVRRIQCGPCLRSACMRPAGCKVSLDCLLAPTAYGNPQQQRKHKGLG